MTNIRNFLLFENKFIDYIFNSILVFMAIMIIFAYPIADATNKLSTLILSLVTSSIICALLFVSWYVVREDILYNSNDRTKNPLRLGLRFCGALITMTSPLYMFLDCMYKFNLTYNFIVFPVLLISMILGIGVFIMSFCVGKK